MSDADDLTVEWFDATTAHRGDEPALTIYTNLNGYVNAAADREWFDGIEHFDLGAVPDEGLLVFRPHGDGHYQFSREEGYGADVSVTAAIKHYWGDLELAETAQVPMREHGDLIVADLSGLLDDGDESAMEFASEDGYQSPPDDEPEAVGVTDDVEIDTAGEDLLAEYHTSQPLVEEYLVEALARGEREFTSREIAEQMSEGVGGRQVGHALSALMKSADAPVAVTQTDQTTDNGAIVWRVEPGVDLAAKLEADRDVDLEAVLGEDADSVQELADALDVEEGEARRRAMDAGVYSELNDHVDRPGVER